MSHVHGMQAEQKGVPKQASHLVAAPGRRYEKSCIDAGPQPHHKEQLCEHCVDLHTIVDLQARSASPGKYMSRYGRLIRTYKEGIPCGNTSLLVPAMHEDALSSPC